jgi:hypothetical protein
MGVGLSADAAVEVDRFVADMIHADVDVPLIEDEDVLGALMAIGLTDDDAIAAALALGA